MAENMMVIFCMLEGPRKQLTDQDSLFVGHHKKNFFLKMNIKKMQTSAYHPEANDCFERCLRTLTPLVKSIASKRDWVDLVKYALFPYKSAPHTNTAFTPSEHIYGRN